MRSRMLFFCAALMIALTSVTSSIWAQINAPQGLTIYRSGTSVTLNWTAVAGASSYNIYKDSNPTVNLSFPYDVSATNNYVDMAAFDAKDFYVVTANVPVGCLSGVVTDTNGVAVANAQVSGRLQSDTTVTFCVKTLSDGSYTICDLLEGAYDVWVYLLYRPVGSYSVAITSDNTTALNHQWTTFTRVQEAGHHILAGTTEVWTNDNVYQLLSYLWVDSGATLIIETGTTIVGTDNPSPLENNFGTLVVSVGGQAFIEGDVCLPIVFTSAKPYGQRRAGDWGGITVMGRAHSNRTNGAGSFPVVANGEGNTGPAGRPDTLFDNESSGRYRYIRLEYAGFRFNDTNELNGIAFYAVGRGTVADHIEAACTKDDAIEFFGGTVSANYVVCHNTGDDGFDWTDGWTGSGQFVVVQARGPESDHAIEADNYENGFDFLPRSNPRLSNFTIIHAKDRPEGTPIGNTGDAVMLRRGTLVNLHNSVVTMGRITAIDMDDSSTAWQASQDVDGIYYHRIVDPSKFSLDNLVFWNNGTVASEAIDASTGAGIGDGHFQIEDAEYDIPNCRTNQRMCINTVQVAAPTGWTQNLAGYRGCGITGSNSTNYIADPLLINPTSVTDSFANPSSDYNPRPAAGSPLLNLSWAAPANQLPAGILYTPYIGAFSGPNDNWMDGWTAFPVFTEN